MLTDTHHCKVKLTEVTEMDNSASLINRNHTVSISIWIHNLDELEYINLQFYFSAFCFNRSKCD